MSDQTSENQAEQRLADLKLENGPPTPEPPKSETPQPSGNGTCETMSFQDNFKIFAIFGDPKSYGKHITLSNSDKWMKQAKVIDGKKITTTDTGIYFKKLKSQKVGIVDYNKFLEDLSKAKKLGIEEIKGKMASCGSPVHHGVGEMSEDFNLCYMEIIYLFLLSLLISALLLIAFRYLVGYVVWGLLIGVVIACLAVSIWLWNVWINMKNNQENVRLEFVPVVETRKRDTLLAFAISATVVTALVILVILVLRKRVQIVVQLFREAGKAIAVMPALILLPVLAFVFLALVIGLWFFFSLFIESAGMLMETSHGIFHYEKNIWMRITRWQNLFAMLWMTQFLVGCQHMVIAGAVSSWYFTRDKSKLEWPIYHSLRNLIRYHLGSVVLGSLVIAIVQFLRIILKFVEAKLKGREGSCTKSVLKCCQCCLYCFEKILKYLTRNAYIEIAAYGYSFCKGGREAFRVLVANALRVAAINSIGDITLFLGKVITVICTVFVGIKLLENKEGLHHMWVPISLAGLFAYFVSHCFLTVYEMIIGTIFLCFCHDCEKNDGIHRPYYMSRGLMSFVENSKKIIEFNESRKYHASINAQVSPSIEPRGG